MSIQSKIEHSYRSDSKKQEKESKEYVVLLIVVDLPSGQRLLVVCNRRQREMGIIICSCSKRHRRLISNTHVNATESVKRETLATQNPTAEATPADRYSWVWASQTLQTITPQFRWAGAKIWHCSAKCAAPKPTLSADLRLGGLAEENISHMCAQIQTARVVYRVSQL